MKRFTYFTIILLSSFLILCGCSLNKTPQSNDVKAESNEIKLSDNTILRKQMETGHFAFYSTDYDKKCISDLSKELQDNYDRITSDLKTKVENKTMVEIYPDIKTFHNEIGEPNALDWLIGEGYRGTIKIVSPLNPGSNHNYNSVKQALVHEFTHVVIATINVGEIPVWLNEGIATYEANQINKGGKDFVKQNAIANKIPTLDDLNNNFRNIEGSYQYSYSLIEFLIKKYGYNKLNNLARQSSDMVNILGITETELENQWIEYIKDNY